MGTFTWQEQDAPPKTIRVTFTVLLRDEWVPLDTCSDDIGGTVDGYLAEDRLSCCAFQGGFLFEVDGVPWNDDGAIDEFRMTMTWFGALNRLCQGDGKQEVWAWEESRLTLIREGMWLDMDDIHHSGHVVMPRLRVPFVAFTEEVLREATRFAGFVWDIREEVNRRRSAGVSDDVEHKLAEIARNMPADIDGKLAELRLSLDSADHG